MRRLFDHDLRNFLASSLALNVMLLVPSARADVARVVVVDAEPKVAQALDVALSPWSLVVVRAPGPLPEPDVAAAASRARFIAGAGHAGAVIWIEPAAGASHHPSLWVYDAETQQIAVRPLGASAPFDDAAAAAVALSVKTILRGSALDASTKQLPPLPPATAATAPTATTPHGSGPTVAEPLGATESTWRSGTESESRTGTDSTWHMEADAAAHTPTAGVDKFQMSGGLGVSFWPRSAGGHIGVGVNARSGPGVTVETALFQGQLVRSSFEATARARVGAARWLALEFQTGPALQVAALAGELRPTTQSAHSTRFDPMWDAAGLVDFCLSPRLSLGASVGASANFLPQHYTVDHLPFTDEPRFVALFGLRVSVGID